MFFHPVANFIFLLLPVVSSVSQGLQHSFRRERRVVQPVDKTLLRQKLGMVCAGFCEPKHFNPLSGITSWFYNYQLGIQNHEVVAWMNEHDIEYVPMIVEDNGGVPLTHTGTRCKMDDVGNGSAHPLCTVDLLVSEIAFTVKQMDVKPVYLMGWNEPFAHNDVVPNEENLPTQRQIDKHDLGPHYIEPAHEAVDWWRRFVQPVAEQTGLKLVSPTGTRKEVQWLGDFLMGCWDHRHSDPPCSLEAIEVFSVHGYECSQSFWEIGYGGLKEEKSFQSLLADVIGSHGRPREDWEEYVASRKIWVTETNCNWDMDEDGPQRDVSPQEMCNRITGNGGEKFGQGSVKTMLAMEAIERFAWWNTFNPNLQRRSMTQHARLVDSEGELLAPGKALVSGLDPGVC